MRNRHLFLLPLLLLTSMAACFGQQKTANDPVPALASQRFEFREDGRLFVIPCESNVVIGKNDPSIRHLVVMVPGLLRQRHYHDAIIDALKEGNAPAGIAVFQPQFLNKADIDAYHLGTDYPYWSNGGWGIGNSSLPANAPQADRVSSFTVMDKLLEDAMQRFPNLKTVTVAGFSAGGQFLNRYAAANRVHEAMEGKGIAVTYIVSSPSSYLYFSKDRATSLNPTVFGPVAKTAYADAKNYDNYRYGLEGLNLYMRTTGAEKIAEQYGKRRVVHMIGEKDDASASRHLDAAPAAMLQGSHRLERAQVYMDYLEHHYGKAIHDTHSLVVVPGAGHNTRGMFLSREGIKTLIDSLKTQRDGH